MSWVNTFSPPLPPPPADHSDPGTWDINFCLPITSPIANDVVELVPFIPCLHADAFWDHAGGSDPDLYQYFRRSFKTKGEFLGFLAFSRRDPGMCTFLVIDRTRPSVPEEGNLGGRMAGMMSYLFTSALNKTTWIGWVLTLKSAQRTHVTTNAAGLLLHYVLNPPSHPTFPGLGLRRVQWTCDSNNTRSLAVATRLGFKREGTLRWQWVLPPGGDGDAPSPHDSERGAGRHDAVHSICWDDWHAGVRDLLDIQMARRA